MSILDQRVIFEDTDISVIVNDFRTENGTLTFDYAQGEYLYVASVLPFNNLWFDVGSVPNTVDANVSIDLFWANSWTPAVDLLDSTNGLKNTGRLQWNTDYLKGWSIVQRPQDQIPELSAFQIYNMYWARFSWDATFNDDATLNYVGQKFSNDAILQSFYPDLLRTNILQAFLAGKTSWDEQHYMAADHIVRDLKKRGIILTRGQILDYAMLTDASCHRVAELIYTAFGKPYSDQLQTAQKAYKEAINLKYFNVDLDANGRLDPIERAFTTGFMSR